MQRAIDGDSTALGQLFETYEPRLRRMVAFRLDERLRGRIDAADVVQECFANLLTKLDVFLGKEDMSLFVWLHLEMGKHLHTIHRRHLTAQARDVRAEVPLVVHGAPGASSFALASAILNHRTPSRVAMKDEQRRRLLEAVEGMKALDREILMLRSFEQLSNREVAQLLELTESGATLRYVRALERLRATLGDLEITSEVLG